jgi:hypothetical protein
VVLPRHQIIYHVFIVNMQPRNPLPFDNPAIYQINVQGKIDQSWSDRLEGMTISLTTGEAGTMITTLEGQLSDQAALAGVLKTLYELHLTVFSVKRLEI